MKHNRLQSRQSAIVLAKVGDFGGDSALVKRHPVDKGETLLSCPYDKFGQASHSSRSQAAIGFS